MLTVNKQLPRSEGRLCIYCTKTENSDSNNSSSENTVALLIDEHKHPDSPHVLVSELMVTGRTLFFDIYKQMLAAAGG